MSEKPAGTALAVAGLVTTALLWGMMIPMTHALATRHLDPFFVSAVRYLIPAPLLLALALIYDRKWPFRAPMPWARVLQLGAAMAMFSLCFTIGIMLSEPVRAAIVMSAGPLVAALLAKLMLRAPLARGFWPAAIAAMVGAALVAMDAVKARASAPGEIAYLGEGLLVCAMVLWSWYSMRAQSWLAPLGFSQMRITLLSSLSGGLLICSLFGILATMQPDRLPTELPAASAIGMLLCIGLGGAGIAILFWNYGVSRIGVPVATLYSSLAPVFAVTVSALFFGATITLQQVAGGILILAGILRMQWMQVRAARAAARAAARQKMV
ncbi:DMT family transporter [Ferrovibrio terrae]|uniref:DMT family transporter n=1 Tax=Ferrovibrio terrae TaxID=2594003 RepID=A0A516H464_9PROT|nr:DMT family transporter [Ferrovibrio terrae]QDO98563.1 DMT family transporter [Ferrovibrio terrae]